MLDIGWWELMVIGMVALVVVGPKELPGLLRTIGRYVGMAKRQADEFRNQFNEALRESEFNDLRNEMTEIKSGVTSSFDDADKAMRDTKPKSDDDLEDDEPMKPAPDIAALPETTSFTTADGEVISKAQPDTVSGDDPPAATTATPAEPTKHQTNGTSHGAIAPARMPGDDAAPEPKSEPTDANRDDTRQDVESVR